MGLREIKRAVLKVERRLRDRLWTGVNRWGERRKFKEPRRVGIYSEVMLTQEQKDAIDRLYMENYGEKIPHTWHRHYTAFTGRFDPCYFPELLFIPEFEYYMNQNVEYAKVFQDKTVLPLLAAAVPGGGIRMPGTYLSCVRGCFRDGAQRLITRREAEEIIVGLTDAFAKPSVGTNSGRGCMLLAMCGGVDRATGRSAAEIIDMLGSDFIIQETVRCHESIRALHPQSVNTFRIITYMWKGRVEHMPVVLRIGRGGSCLDNAHAGGTFVAVSDNGELHETAFTEFRERYTQHPDTGIVYAGYRIDLTPRVLEAAKRMHSALPQVGCVSWDFTIDEEGEPLLIEANMIGGGVWIVEMAHGCGPFGERTAEVLRWLRLCRRTPVEERARYACGRMGDE